MTDTGGLGVVALILYLLESAAWVPEGAEAYRLSLRRRARLARESWSLERPRGRIVMGSLPPGTGGVALCEARPPRLSPHGICACGLAAESGDPTGQPIRWEELDPIRADGRAVRSGARTIWTAGTAAYAAHLAGVAESVRGDRAERRATAIERELDRLLDDAAVRERASRLRRASWVLRGIAWAMTLLLVVAVPLAIARRDWILLLALIAGVWALAVMNTLLYSRRRRTLVDAPGTGGHSLVMLLMPLAALRADDLLARDVFATRHALAVARGTDAQPPWLRRDPASEDGEAAPCCAAGEWLDAAWARRASQRMAQGTARVAPHRASPDAVAYCPRCQQQYARLGDCADCTGVTLQPIE